MHTLVTKTFITFICFVLTLFGTTVQAATLTTTSSGGNGANGNIFDIVATNDVAITGFDVHIDGTCTETVEIYYRTDSGYDNLSSLSDWTLLDSASVTGGGVGTLVAFPNTLSLTIPAGSTYGFYITTDGSGSCGFSYTNGSNVGNVYASDSDISITDMVPHIHSQVPSLLVYGTGLYIMNPS